MQQQNKARKQTWQKRVPAQNQNPRLPTGKNMGPRRICCSQTLPKRHVARRSQIVSRGDGAARDDQGPSSLLTYLHAVRIATVGFFFFFIDGSLCLPPPANVPEISMQQLYQSLSAYGCPPCVPWRPPPPPPEPTVAVTVAAQPAGHYSVATGTTMRLCNMVLDCPRMVQPTCLASVHIWLDSGLWPDWANHALLVLKCVKVTSRGVPR